MKRLSSPSLVPVMFAAISLSLNLGYTNDVFALAIQVFHEGNKWVGFGVALIVSARPPPFNL